MKQILATILLLLSHTAALADDRIIPLCTGLVTPKPTTIAHLSAVYIASQIRERALIKAGVQSSSLKKPKPSLRVEEQSVALRKMFGSANFVVRIAVDAKGNVLDTKIEKSSGLISFDESALQMIAEAAPFRMWHSPKFKTDAINQYRVTFPALIAEPISTGYDR